jgi:hypothetical protein
MGGCLHGTPNEHVQLAYTCSASSTRVTCIAELRHPRLRVRREDGVATLIY